MNNSQLFFLVGPSGVGKTTVRDYILNSLPNFRYIPSYTSRPQRLSEVNASDYFFISENEFIEKISENEFIEWEEHYKYYYGIIESDYINSLEDGFSLIKEIAYGGLLDFLNKTKIKKSKIHSLFFMPSSIQDLYLRMGKRNQSASDILIRMKSIESEIQNSSNCDTIIISKTGEVEKLCRDTVDYIKLFSGI